MKIMYSVFRTASKSSQSTATRRTSSKSAQSTSTTRTASKWDTAYAAALPPVLSPPNVAAVGAWVGGTPVASPAAVAQSTVSMGVEVVGGSSSVFTHDQCLSMWNAASWFAAQSPLLSPASLSETSQGEEIYLLLLFLLYTLLSLSGNSGRLTWVRLQQPQEQRYPVLQVHAGSFLFP